jgi:hypothetical protein
MLLLLCWLPVQAEVRAVVVKDKNTCISIDWHEPSNDGVIQWFTIKNSCSEKISVNFGTESYSSRMELPPNGQDKSWISQNKINKYIYWACPTPAIGPSVYFRGSPSPVCYYMEKQTNNKGQLKDSVDHNTDRNEWRSRQQKDTAADLFEDAIADSGSGDNRQKSVLEYERQFQQQYSKNNAEIFQQTAQQVVSAIATRDGAGDMGAGIQQGGGSGDCQVRSETLTRQIKSLEREALASKGGACSAGRMAIRMYDLSLPFYQACGAPAQVAEIQRMRREQFNFVSTQCTR